MKKTAAFLLACLLAAGVFAQTVIGYYTITKTVAATATPEALVATNLLCSKATFLGKKAYRTSNTSTAYLGTSSVNDEQAFPLPVDGEVVITASDGKKINLRDWYLDVGTAADGVVIFIEP